MSRLPQKPSDYSNIQKVLMTVVIVLTVVAVCMCTTVLVYLLSAGVRLSDALSFTVVLLGDYLYLYLYHLVNYEGTKPY